MQGTKFAKADKNKLSGLFKYLDGCLEQIVKDNELGALKQALKVKHTVYTLPIAGGRLRKIWSCLCTSLLGGLMACT